MQLIWNEVNWIKLNRASLLDTSGSSYVSKGSYVKPTRYWTGLAGIQECKCFKIVTKWPDLGQFANRFKVKIK
jgi:hypothetical protein